MRQKSQRGRAIPGVAKRRVYSCLCGYAIVEDQPFDLKTGNCCWDGEPLCSERRVGATTTDDRERWQKKLENFCREVQLQYSSLPHFL